MSFNQFLLILLNTHDLIITAQNNTATPRAPRENVFMEHSPHHPISPHQKNPLPEAGHEQAAHLYPLHAIP